MRRHFKFSSIARATRHFKVLINKIIFHLATFRKFGYLNDSTSNYLKYKVLIHERFVFGVDKENGTSLRCRLGLNSLINRFSPIANSCLRSFAIEKGLVILQDRLSCYGISKIMKDFKIFKESKQDLDHFS